MVQRLILPNNRSRKAEYPLAGGIVGLRIFHLASGSTLPKLQLEIDWRIGPEERKIYVHRHFF